MSRRRTYTVKLTVGERSYTQPLIVKQDPRVRTAAINLTQLYTMMRGSYFDAAEARTAMDSARRLREQVDRRRATAPEPVKSTLDGFDKRLEALIGAAASAGGRGGGRGGGPAAATDSLGGSVSRLVALARDLGAADVQLTAEQTKNVADARAAAQRVSARWKVVSSTELATLNAALTKAGVEPIK